MEEAYIIQPGFGEGRGYTPYGLKFCGDSWLNAAVQASNNNLLVDFFGGSSRRPTRVELTRNQSNPPEPEKGIKYCP